MYESARAETISARRVAIARDRVSFAERKRAMEEERERERERAKQKFDVLKIVSLKSSIID